MRIVAFIVSVLLILTGGGCLIAILASGARMTDELNLFVLGFGVLPALGGGLLFYYALRDRGSGGEDQQ